MATLQRVHGGAASGAFYGYQPIFLKVSGTNVSTPDTLVNGNVTATNNFTKVVSAIQQIGSIVFIGPATSDGFVVAIDGATANAGVAAGATPENATNFKTLVAANMQAIVRTASGVAGALVIPVELTALGVTA